MANHITSNNDVHTSSVPALSPQLSIGAQDSRYAFSNLGGPFSLTPFLGSEINPINAFGQSALEPGLPQELHDPHGGHRLPQLQPLPSSSVSAWNNNQWSPEAATSNQLEQWPYSAFVDTQQDQAFLSDLFTLENATLDFNWTSVCPVTAAHSLVMHAPSFALTPDTQLQMASAMTASTADTAFGTQDDILTCPQGCPATFGRAVDYRRHMLNHQPHKFKCMFANCDKTFPRMDKLNDHFRQGHHSDMKITRAAARTNPKKATGEKRARR